MPSSKGALVAGIIDGGPVANGSILAGDVIIRFDGKAVNNVKDLPRVVAESPVGKEVDVVIVRKGKEETVKVTLGRLEDSEQQAKKDDQTGQGEDGAVQNVDVLGMTLDTLNDDTRKSFGISKEVQGVLITEVQNDSIAANKRIQAGDVIVDIAQESGFDTGRCRRPNRETSRRRPQECSPYACVKDRRTALRDTSNGLIRS